MIDGMSGWNMQVNGWSGLAAASTGWGGTGATAAAPATAANAAATPQGSQSIGITCGICQQPVARQGIFFLAVVLLALAWHFHLHSMLE